MSMADLIAAMDESVLSHLSAGETITYRAGDTSVAAIDGLFDSAYEFVGAGEPGISSRHPVVFTRLDALPSDPDLDDNVVVTVSGVEYELRSSEKDGKGAVLLVLHRFDA